MLRRVQDLMRHVLPEGDPAVIFHRALKLLEADLEKRRFAAVANPRASEGVADGSRRIPAEVRRAVWSRDGGHCAFVGVHGQCNETGRLEFHHIRPFAQGGEATVENIELRCRAHNQHEADLFSGVLIARERREVFGVDAGAPSQGAVGNSVWTERKRLRSGLLRVPLESRGVFSREEHDEIHADAADVESSCWR